MLVMRGEAGVGKSALVEHLVGNAAACRVVRAAGVEWEMELAFAGLHQLCLPMMDHLDRLPGPQRDALAVAFGLSAASAPDRFLVGLAVLSLLAEVAEEQPLVCVVDDAQWLDRISAQTLAFVARRLLAERIAFVFAIRVPPPGADPDPGDDLLIGLPELVVGGLRDADARALLGSAVPGRLDERVRERVVAETRGNPLALLELPRGMTAAELAGGFGPPDARPLAGQIEESFLRRIRALPVATQRLLLAAAAEPVGNASMLRRAAERLAIGVDAAAPAEAAGLIEIGARVRFRHPLVRSAAYRAADPAARSHVHQALAEATDPEADPDRRAWHRANAAQAPDEAVADELESSANRARARGGVAAAAAFLERAAQLTPDPARRATRALAAAHAHFEAGASGVALELVVGAELGPPDDLLRARLARLRAQIVFARRRAGDGMPMLLDAARRLEQLDDREAREAYLDAIGAAVFAGRLDQRGGLRRSAAAARAAPQGLRPPQLVDLLLDGLATRFTEGYVAGAEPLGRALLAFRRDPASHEDAVMRWLWLTWLVAGDLWDDEAWYELTTHAVRVARQAGALNLLPLALSYRAAVHVHAGEFAAAAALIEESDSITAATGNAPLRYASTLLVAWRGVEPPASEIMRDVAREATARGEGRAAGGTDYLIALLNNGLGRYRAALSCAERACEHDDLGVLGFSLVELVEAGARGDARDAAESALRRLAERAVASGTDLALGLVARSRALLSGGGEAESLYREAVERLARTRMVVYLARTHLVYGEWLRREGRRLDAREELRTAHGMFSGYGAVAFAERARVELLATGEAVRRGASDALEPLTAQEAQIARRAADGMTNPEIGAELFISARTVEWHLHKVFAKLDIDSRSKLPAALRGL